MITWARRIQPSPFPSPVKEHVPGNFSVLAPLLWHLSVPVQKNDRRTVGGSSFGVSNIQDAGIDLLH